MSSSFQIIDAAIRVDADTGRPRGFAIVTFSDEASVNSAVAVQEHLLDGKIVEVKRVDKNATRSKFVSLNIHLV